LNTPQVICNFAQAEFLPPTLATNINLNERRLSLPTSNAFKNHLLFSAIYFASSPVALFLGEWRAWRGNMVVANFPAQIASVGFPPVSQNYSPTLTAARLNTVDMIGGVFTPDPTLSNFINTSFPFPGGFFQVPAMEINGEIDSFDFGCTSQPTPNVGCSLFMYAAVISGMVPLFRHN
jgi:hypothetical protein